MMKYSLTTVALVASGASAMRLRMEDGAAPVTGAGNFAGTSELARTAFGEKVGAENDVMSDLHMQGFNCPGYVLENGPNAVPPRDFIGANFFTDRYTLNAADQQLLKAEIMAWIARGEYQTRPCGCVLERREFSVERAWETAGLEIVPTGEEGDIGVGMVQCDMCSDSTGGRTLVHSTGLNFYYKCPAQCSFMIRKGMDICGRCVQSGNLRGNSMENCAEDIFFRDHIRVMEMLEKSPIIMGALLISADTRYPAAEQERRGARFAAAIQSDPDSFMATLRELEDVIADVQSGTTDIADPAVPAIETELYVARSLLQSARAQQAAPAEFLDVAEGQVVPLASMIEGLRTTLADLRAEHAWGLAA